MNEIRLLKKYLNATRMCILDKFDEGMNISQVAEAAGVNYSDAYGFCVDSRFFDSRFEGKSRVLKLTLFGRLLRWHTKRLLNRIREKENEASV